MSAKTKLERHARLISHGYFAPELPPCFVCHDLANNRKEILKEITKLPLSKKGDPAYYSYVSEPCWFYFPRFGKDDRRHGIINPISYFFLSKAIADNFVSLRSLSKKSGISSSPLIFDWTGRRALSRASVDLRDDFRLDLCSRTEEFVSADIRAFFHSIYTHSIPWAIYGKKHAKRNRKLTDYGNLIDLLCRNSQGGQTIGLPVGPDTSRLLAEVIASAIDRDFKNKIKITNQDASRYIDDYTIGSIEGHSGESLISALRDSVSLFELELNNDKSIIHLSSSRLNDGWKQSIIPFVPSPPFSEEDFQRFFYEVGKLSDAHKDINVERFAYQNARNAFVNAGNWKKTQSRILGAYKRNSSLISFLVEVLIVRDLERNDLDKINIREFLEHRIPKLSMENRTGEIVWFLFLCIRIGINLSSKCIESCFHMENGVISLMIAEMGRSGNIYGRIDFGMWNQSLNGDGLKSPMWLYAYEGVRRGSIPGAADKFISSDSFFAPLLKKNVKFLEPKLGFLSLSSLMRAKKLENERMRKMRGDFNDGFDWDFYEFDQDFDDEIIDDVDDY